MRKQTLRAREGWVLLVAIVLGAQALPVAADGGVVPLNPSVWASLLEEQQIAVVRLESAERAQVDLFIAMIDASGEPHEVTFFVPLGAVASDFAVAEEPCADFESKLTYRMAKALHEEVGRAWRLRRSLRVSLFFGTLLIHGGWSWPLWIAWLLDGCAAADQPEPIATYETESSQVDIYGSDATADLEALITTARLDPAVRGTLERLRGQQIAVVHLRTQALDPSLMPGQYRAGGRQPGLHLHWTTRLTPSAAGSAYRYPLGTGTAWAHPISVTSVYVTAPRGIDFVIDYPRLGEDLSGYEVSDTFWRHRHHARIEGVKRPAFAVEEQVRRTGRIWHVTYIQSNATEDIVITAVNGLTPDTRAKLRQLDGERALVLVTWPVSALVALALWVAAWKLIMARMLGITLGWGELRLWREALAWALLYPLSNALAVGFCLVTMQWTEGVAIIVTLPMVLLVAAGVVSLFLFVRRGHRREGLPRGKAALAYVLVAGATNLAYLVYALAAAAALGVL